MTSIVKYLILFPALISLAKAQLAFDPILPCSYGGDFPCTGDCEEFGAFEFEGACWEMREILTTQENETANCSTEYRYLDIGLSFDKAQEACESFGYNLAAFVSFEQLEQVALAVGFQEYWIGMRSNAVSDSQVLVDSFEYIPQTGIQRTFGNVARVSPWSVFHPVQQAEKLCIQQDRGGFGQFWQNVDCEQDERPLCQKSPICREIDECSCGQLNMPPCAFEECAKWLTYNNTTDRCESCGAHGEVPCEEDGCYLGLTEHNGLCTYCGIRGAPKCEGQAEECIDGNMYDETLEICVECGGKDQLACKARLRWYVARNDYGCVKKCCSCNGKKCYQWDKTDGNLLVGNECSGLFQFTYRGEYPNANITVPSPVSCSSTGQGASEYENCEVEDVQEYAIYCNDLSLFPRDGRCVHECELGGSSSVRRLL